MSDSVNRADETGFRPTAGPGADEEPVQNAPQQPDLPTEPSDVFGEVNPAPDPVLPAPEAAPATGRDLRYVAWTTQKVCHVLDDTAPVAKTVCGNYPRPGNASNGRLKEVLFLDSPGVRKTCERCLRIVTGQMDIKKATPVKQTTRRIISR